MYLPILEKDLEVGHDMHTHKSLPACQGAAIHSHLRNELVWLRPGVPALCPKTRWPFRSKVIQLNDIEDRVAGTELHPLGHVVHLGQEGAQDLRRDEQ